MIDLEKAGRCQVSQKLHLYDDGHECRQFFSLAFAIALKMEPDGDYRACEKCGEVKRCIGAESVHYVPSVGHLTEPADAIEPYWTCQRG